MSALTVLITRKLASRACMLVSLVVLFPAVALLIAAQALASMQLLVAGTALSGICGALGYRGSLQVVNQIAPVEQRAGVTSAYFLVCFIGNSVPVIAVAVLARASSSLVADGAFAASLAVLAAAALSLSLANASASRDG